MSPARVLGAVWDAVKTLGAKLRFNRGRILWYAPFYVGAAGQVFNVWAQLVGDEPPDYGHALTGAILGVMLALWPIAARAEYRRAWRTGFLEGIHVPAEVFYGRVPDIVTRQSVTGEAAPEPWESAAAWDLEDSARRKAEGETP